MPEMVIAEIDATLREFHTDPDRVYLSGFSMGAAGAYAIASRWPNRFAAMFAIGGLVPRDLGELAEKLRGIPTRLFHGEADERVPVNQSRALVAALKGIGASVRYTEYPATRHGPAAEMAYADPELLEWLLAQRRSSGH